MNSSFILHPSSFPKKAFVIAAAGSSSGKTTTTIALLSWLKANGYTPAPFKVGPDFIDPGHHTKVSGRTCYNLDSWMLSRAYNSRLFEEKTKGADIAVVEGVMGLFDGYDGLSEAGSTAQMAKWLNLPVILIVNARGMARSAAAIVKGFETFDPDLTIAGVIFTKVGSQRHFEYLKLAVEQSCGARVLGYLPKNENIVMPERHLGLVTADELDISGDTLSLLTAMVDDHLDMDALICGLPKISQPIPQHQPPAPPAGDSRPVIAVARDKAFCFYYPDNLEILEQFGAKIVQFSPLEEDSLPDPVDGLYFGGGYPELYAKELAQKRRLLEQVNRYSQMGMPIYGECGGFMFLCRELSGMDSNDKYAMSGCFDFQVSMSKRLRSLGYRQVTLKQDTVIGKKGDVLRGHEFHYSSLTNPEIETSDIYAVQSRAGQDISLKGFQRFNTLGSYLHVHFGSNPASAETFVAACRHFKGRRQL
jgi:cobyrinic acid a,c-diamide synthase